jgi:hypothetical protein
MQRRLADSPSLHQLLAGADENALSRIYVGIHFRDAVETGTKDGEKIRSWTVTHVLRPVP